MACTTTVGKSMPTGDLVGLSDTQTITNKTINIDTGGNSIVGTTWSVLYTDGSGVVTELGLGTTGQILQSNGTTAAPSWSTPTGGGNVSNTGTPVDGQIPVWTNSTTIEGDPSLTFDTTTNYLNINVDGDTGSRIYLGADDYITNNLTSAGWYLGGSAAITFATVGAGRNVEVGGASGEFGGTTPGSGVLKLPDVTTTPVGTLTGGGMLYVSGTNLFFHDDAGTAHNLTADGGGNVSNTGTPADNQIAVWTDSTTIEGDSALTFDTSTDTLSVGSTSGNLNIGGTAIINNAGGGSITLGGISTLDSTTKNTVNKLDIVTNTNTAWTLALSDNWSFVRANNASAITITIPTNAAVAFPIGSTLFIQKLGAGNVTISPDSGVTLTGISTITTQYRGTQLVKVDTNVWTSIG